MNDNLTLIGATTEYGDQLPVYDDGFGDVWLYREAGGLYGIVRTNSWHKAYEICLDEIMNRVAEDEVIEAYGLYIIDWRSDWYLCPEFETEDGYFEWFNNEYPGRRVLGRYASKIDAEVAAKRYIGEHEPDLIEGYEYQPNATGTGIVSIDLNGQELRPLTAELRSQLGITLQVTQD